MLWAVAAGGMVAACSDGTAPTPALLTALPRALTSQEQSIIAASNAFTVALFQKASAAEPAKNVFISPLSASMSLGMALNGARNQTLTDMQTALQLSGMSQADINAGYKSLMSLLIGLDPTIESHVANSIWYRSDLPIDPAFAQAGHDFFDAEVSALDFTKASSVTTINAWVSDKTAGRIPTILETIDPADVMFLINAIYFKGSWRQRFDPATTQTASFSSAAGAQQVPMMHLEATELRASSSPDGTKSVELPYGNGAFVMDVHLPPDTSSVEKFITRLTADGVAPLLGTAGAVHFWMPRLKLDYKRTLNADLVALGMAIAFTDGADFGGMTTVPKSLAISDVLQKTFLSIDEEGTEAAAVTKTDNVDSSAPLAFTMRCDRPYVIVIRERLSGTIVFIGKINSI